ncbi:asparagine synthase-related protein [Streptomyces sp. JNUCC 64]
MRNDDLAYARRTAAAVAGVRHHVFRGGEDVVLYAGLEEAGVVPVTDEPTLYTATAGIKRAQLDLVGGPGGVYFTGEGGDVVLSASAAYLADLYRARRRREAWHHTLGHARVRRVSPLTLWRRVRFLADGGVPGGWRQAADAIRAAGAPRPARAVTSEDAARQVLSPCAQWMTPEVRALLADQIGTAAAAVPRHRDGLADWTDRQDLIRIGASLSGWHALAREHDVELATPYLDNEVIRACLAIEAAERGVADRYKPLLAAAFPDGPVPGFVLERTTKGGLDQVAHAGLVRNAGVLADLLGPSSRLAALGLLPPGGIGGDVRAAASGLPGGAGAIHYAVAAELWLRQIASFPAPWTVRDGDGHAVA